MVARWGSRCPGEVLAGWHGSWCASGSHRVAQIAEGTALIQRSYDPGGSAAHIGAYVIDGVYDTGGNFVLSSADLAGGRAFAQHLTGDANCVGHIFVSSAGGCACAQYLTSDTHFIGYNFFVYPAGGRACAQYFTGDPNFIGYNLFVYSAGGRACAPYRTGDANFVDTHWHTSPRSHVH